MDGWKDGVCLERVDRNQYSSIEIKQVGITVTTLESLLFYNVNGSHRSFHSPH